MKQRVLIVDDDTSIRESLKFLLEETYSPLAVSSGEEALELLNRTHIDAILLDIKMEGMDGLETLKKIRERHEYLVVIMLTVVEDIKTAVTAIKLGADDYLRKPYDKDELLISLEENLKIKNGQREILYLRSELERQYDSEAIVGPSKVMEEVFKLIDRAARTDTTVLITGETGTGKELVAQQLHQKSDRQEKPFVVVDCAAIPKELLESELFGYEKGAFTGAHKQKLGKIELAGSGTVFFDEIGNMSLELQAKLLRVLQEKTFERVGGTAIIPTNARFIFATNEDLKQSIKKGNFREDLYYRIHVFPIHLPPLRERREDIPILVKHFIKKFSLEQRKNVTKVSPEAMDYLIRYSWPGNVRQLENETERIVTLVGDDLTTVTPDLLSADIHKGPDKISLAKQKGSLPEAVAFLEQLMIREALEKFDGNKTRAAELLGLSRRGLQKMLSRFSMSTDE